MASSDQQLQRQAAVHTAAQQHRHAQPTATKATTIVTVAAAAAACHLLHVPPEVNLAAAAIPPVQLPYAGRSVGHSASLPLAS